MLRKFDNDPGWGAKVPEALRRRVRDFSYIAPDIPEFVVENCVGCMDCVTQCPDTAILAKVADPSMLADRLATIPDEELRQSMGRSGWRLRSTTPSSRRKA